MEEVKVSGALIFILRVSCFVGVSPVSFRHSHGGCYVTFSYATAFYGYFIVTSINVLPVIAFILDVKVYNRFPIGRFIDITSSIIISSLLCYNIKARINSIILHISTLNKIKVELSYLTDKSPSLDKNLLIFSLGTWALSIITTALTFMLFILNAHNVLEYFYLSLSCYSVQIITYETQIIILNLKVYEVLKNLTEELHNQLGVIESGQPTVISTMTNCRKIANAYMSVCKVVDQMNEKEGTILFCLIANLVFYILYSTCSTIQHMNNKSWFLVLHCLLWIAIYLFRLCLIVDSCHYISKEAVKIRILLSKLVCYTTPAGQPCNWEWETIFKQMYLVVPTFTPFGMVTINRSLLTTIISVVTTYLAIVIPYIKNFYGTMTFY